jgi:hypothetical protein
VPRSTFIEMPGMPGEGRCRICDLPYSRNLPREVANHREFHAKYLKACDGVGAPVPQRDRKRMIAEGLELQRTGGTLDERVRGAELWLVGMHNDHLFGALLYGKRQLDLREFFTRMEKDGLKGRFDDDVAAVLAFRYSDRFQP